MVLPVVAVDVEVLLECLDWSLTKSICLLVLGSREASVNLALSVQLFEVLRSKLRTAIGS